MELTSSQLRAVDLALIQRDTCVVAGPGSGKTAVLVECYRRLVMDAGIEPTRLLAITFTERAARSMKQKLADAFQGLDDLRRQLEQGSVSTVHGFCARLLRENAIFAGVDPEFGILEAREASQMQTRVVRETLDTLFEREPKSMGELMKSMASPDFEKLLLGLHDGTRSAGLEIPALGGFRLNCGAQWNELTDALRDLPSQAPFKATVKQKATLQEALASCQAILVLAESPVTLAHFQALAAYKPGKNLRDGDQIGSRLKRIRDELIPAVKRQLISEYYAPQRETILQTLLDFDRNYAEAKRKESKLDFSDLETFAVRLLAEHPDVRREITSKYQYVLMDEFQDTNGQQAKLLELLRPPDRFYAVGDINQSIYGFRHANPDVFRRYRDDVSTSGHLVELDENWRSRDGILRAALTILHEADGIEPRNLVARRALSGKTQPSVEVIAAVEPDTDVALDIEAAWVARRIREFEGQLALAHGPATFGDMALLLRNLEVLPAFTRAFDEANIPYLVSQGKGFFETREVLDLTHLLRVLDNPRDEISMAAVLRSPFAAISDETLLRLKLDGNLSSALRRLPHRKTNAFDSGDHETLTRLREQLSRWRAMRDTASFDRLLLAAMEETGYAWQPGTRAAANIEKFLALARSATGPLSRFVEDLEEFREADPREPDPPPEDAANAVRVMTIHAAKGLEFPIVLLGALHKGVKAEIEHLSFSPDIGFGVCWRNPATAVDEDDCFQNGIGEDRKLREERESDRLLYVAMTRAEEHLVLSLSARKGWAKEVEARLGLDLKVPQDTIKTISSPDGGSFTARIFASDHKPAQWGHTIAVETTSPVQLLERPERRDQHDSTTSVTDVALFADCPRRYYLARYLKFEPNRRRWSPSFDPEEPDDEQDDQPDATELGIQVHRLLAGAEVIGAHSEAHRLAQAFRESRLGQRAVRASRIEREWDFLLTVDDVVLRGQIDLWFEEAGEVVLVDYKTTEVDLDHAEARAAEYAPQLWLYALALQRATGREPDHAYIYFPRADAAVPIDLRPTLFNDPQTLVREFRDAQSRLEFPLREAERCRRCPYYHGICPAGTHASGMPDVIHPAAIDGEDLGGDEASLA